MRDLWDYWGTISRLVYPDEANWDASHGSDDLGEDDAVLVEELLRVERALAVNPEGFSDPEADPETVAHGDCRLAW